MNDIVMELASVKDTLEEHVHVNTGALEEAMDTLETGEELSGEDLDEVAAQIDDAIANVSSLIESLLHDRDRLEQAKAQVEQASADAYEREDDEALAL
jgi:ABC-type transporter Mla subunit MlaD